MTASSTLKPCPDIRGHFPRVKDFGGAFRVECSCGKKWSTAKTPEDAIELWNRIDRQEAPHSAPSRDAPDSEKMRVTLEEIFKLARNPPEAGYIGYCKAEPIYTLADRALRSQPSAPKPSKAFLKMKEAIRLCMNTPCTAPPAWQDQYRKMVKALSEAYVVCGLSAEEEAAKKELGGYDE